VDGHAQGWAPDVAVGVCAGGRSPKKTSIPHTVAAGAGIKPGPAHAPSPKRTPMPLELDFSLITSQFAAMPEAPPPPPPLLLGRETPWPVLLASLHGTPWSGEEQTRLLREIQDQYQRVEVTAAAGGFLATFLHPAEFRPYNTTETYRAQIRTGLRARTLPLPSSLSRLARLKGAEWLREQPALTRRVFI
jgi:hypothetical protein